MTRISGSFHRSNFFEACTNSLHTGQCLQTRADTPPINQQEVGVVSGCGQPCIILAECLLSQEEVEAVHEPDVLASLGLLLAAREVVLHVL